MTDTGYDAFVSYSHAADDLLAPRLQAGLQRFAKPWWRRRALRIFRDESSLSASPHLWASIVAAMEGSGWFVLLLSPEAAASPWVNREIGWWVANKPPGRIIPVLTDGAFTWADGDVSGDAVPEALEGVFPDEPRWVDLSFASDEEQLDLKNPRFSAAVADIASALRGIPKDELESEDVRQHRRTIRTAWAAGILVLILAVAAAVGAVVAAGQARQARDQRSEAQRQTEIALDNEQLARRNEERAEQSASDALVAQQLARSRELAASAINALADDPSRAKLLALAAASLADPPLEVISALHRAYAADIVVARYTWPEDGYLWADLHPSGRLVVASGATPSESGNYLEVADLVTAEVLWSHRFEEDALSVGPAFFSPGGEWVVAGVYWEPVDGGDGPRAQNFRDVLGVYVWETETGELVDRFDLGRCGGIVADVSTTHLLVRTRSDTVAECWATPIPGTPDVAIELIDMGSGDREVLTSAAPLLYDSNTSFSGDGRFVGFEDWSTNPVVGVVVDLRGGERILEYDPLSAGTPGSALRHLNHDGSLLLEGRRPTRVWSLRTGAIQCSIESTDADLGVFPIFDPSRDLIYATTLGTLRAWDAMTCEELWAIRDVGAGRISLSDDGLIMVSDPEPGEAVVLDTGPRGEIGAVKTCEGGWLPALATSLRVVGGVAAFHGGCADPPLYPWYAHIIDVREDPALVHSIPEVGGQVVRLSPDGRSLAVQDAAGRVTGSILVRDVATGAVLVEMEGLCGWSDEESTAGIPRHEMGHCRPYPEHPFAMWAQEMEWSPHGTLIVAVDRWDSPPYLAVWDAATGGLLFTAPYGGSITFSPDSKRLVVSIFGERMLRVLSTETWEVAREASFDPSLEGGGSLGLAGYSADGKTLLGVGGLGSSFSGEGGAALHWFDADTLEHLRTRPRIHEGSPQSMALSPDRSLLATGGSDGYVRVWDSETGALVHEIPLGDTLVQGVAFVDDQHLAVTPREGNLFIFTLDVDELLRLVRKSLTRGFTEFECERFNFDDQCPTLEELRDG